MEPIRVLHILHSMNRGGAESLIMNYYEFIDRDRIQFDFLLTEQNKCHYEDRIRELGGCIYRIPYLKFSSLFQYLKGLNLFFKNHKDYKIVHSHTSSKSFFPLAIAWYYGIPIRIAHSHNSNSKTGLINFIRSLLKYPLKIVASHYFSCGKDAARWLYGKRMLNAGRIVLIPNVINTSIFDYNPLMRISKRSKYNINNDAIVLGCTARFSYQKNHIFLVSIFEAVCKRNSDSWLLLIGDGEMSEVILQAIIRKKLEDRVLFLGVVNNVNDYLQAMDFFVMPSFYEGLPLSLIEAQVSGLKCFASVGVPREADITGLVSFMPLEKGPEYWADAIIKEAGYNRRSYIEEVRKAGYDAAEAAINLQEFYLNSINE